jgi:outer membrane lipoprotein-sorting protein
MGKRAGMFLAVGCLLAFVASGAAEVQSGEAVVSAMHARYEKSWYDAVTFTQKSTTYNADGTTKVETWYEAASLPGKLRIDYGQPSEGNGLVLADGNATSVQAGKESATRPLLNLLLVLGFDVYRQAPEITLGQLKHEGIDVTKFHEELWNGEPAYVVGADKGDLKSKQFWVEKKRLLFVRLLQPYQRDLSKTTDTRFVDYREAGKGMIAARVEVYRDEKMVFSEGYTEIKIDVKLDAGTFDPKQFNTTHWENSSPSSNSAHDDFAKYRAVEAYEVRPGILLMPRYSADGHVCEIGLATRHYSPELIRLDSQVSPDVVEQIFKELVPDDERGLRTAFDGLIMGRGKSITTNIDYEYVSVQIYSEVTSQPKKKPVVSDTIAAVIRWKNRECQKP